MWFYVYVTVKTAMPKRYSEDLRCRVVYMVCLQGKTIQEVSRDMYVSHSTVDRWVHLYRTTGDVKSLQDKHRPEGELSEFEEVTVLQSFLNNPGIHLNEVQHELLDITRTWVSLATIYAKQHTDLDSRQKMKNIAIGRSEVLRAKYMPEIKAFDPFSW